MKGKSYTRTAAGDFGRSLVNFSKNAPSKEEAEAFAAAARLWASLLDRTQGDAVEALGLFQAQLRQVAARQVKKRQYFEDIISLSREAGL